MYYLISVNIKLYNIAMHLLREGQQLYKELLSRKFKRFGKKNKVFSKYFF
jgi:hypothetical protein